MLQAQQVTTYRGLRCLFHHFNLNVSAGELWQVLGPNGSGKTTLLKLLSGLLPLQEGQVLWRGHSIHRDRWLYYRELFYLGHCGAVKEELTVLENIRWVLPRSTASIPLLNTLLEEWQLDHLKHAWVRHLSRGQRQRVALIKLILSDTLLWILDEPFSSLDSLATEKMSKVLETQVNQGGCVIVANHSPLTFAGFLPHTLRLPESVSA
ncbi:MAG: heme ABC exporter, ATP-binding protein CcmA [Coxiella sp. RIFCSPHIGHO2_12_FULL_44_14]|nr:MAG: heme ABC exporter, ATP-binding protein CcmA [Coxiella sp. RIFCSPHIGHO2_12_FULL_44_14]